MLKSCAGQKFVVNIVVELDGGGEEGGAVEGVGVGVGDGGGGDGAGVGEAFLGFQELSGGLAEHIEGTEGVDAEGVEGVEVVA